MQQFRDRDRVMFKVDQVDALAGIDVLEGSADPQAQTLVDLGDTDTGGDADKLAAFATLYDVPRRRVEPRIRPPEAVLSECRKADAWLKANPEKRKTHRGMRGFLVRWLTRENDRNGLPPSPEVMRARMRVPDTGPRLRDLKPGVCIDEPEQEANNDDGTT